MNASLGQLDGFEPVAGDLSGRPLVSLLILAVMLTTAVYHEVRENRIPNWLTYTGMALGLGLAAVSGRPALFSSVGGLAIGFGFLFVFFLFGGVGGGDVKLMGAAGALMGFSLIQPAVVFTAVLGGILAVLTLIWHRDFWGYLSQRLRFWRKASASGSVEVPTPCIVVPYGLAIAAGCLLAVSLRGIS
jgi:prepilin peptidase CpaA